LVVYHRVGRQVDADEEIDGGVRHGDHEQVTSICVECRQCGAGAAEISLV
jgi:hypothetical protein